METSLLGFCRAQVHSDDGIQSFVEFGLLIPVLLKKCFALEDELGSPVRRLSVVLLAKGSCKTTENRGKSNSHRLYKTMD